MKRIAVLTALVLLHAVSAVAQDPRVTGTIAGSSQCVTLTGISNRSTVAIDISGTFVARLQTSLSTNGTTWRPATVAGATTSVGLTTIPLDGASAVRVCAAAYTSGTATVVLTAGNGHVSAEYVSRSLTITWTPTTFTWPGNLDLRGMKKLSFMIWGDKNGVSFTPQYLNSFGDQHGLSGLGVQRWPTAHRVTGSVTPGGTFGWYEFAIPPDAETLVDFWPGSHGTGTATITITATNEPLDNTLLTLNGYQENVLPIGGVFVGGSDYTGYGNFQPLRLTAPQDRNPSQADQGLIVHLAWANSQARTVLQGTSPWVISTTSLPLPTGAATETTLAALNAKVTAVNTGSVTVASSALPTGAATEATVATLATAANQTNRTQQTRISDGAGNARSANVTASNALVIDGSAVTQPISASSLPLPAGAASEATLSSLNGKVTAVDTGNVTVGSSVLPTGAATQSTLATIARTVSTPGNPADLYTAIAGVNAGDDVSPVLILGASPVADDPGVVVRNIPSGTQAISAASLPLPTGATTEATLANVQGGTDALAATVSNGSAGSGLGNIIRVGGLDQSDGSFSSATINLRTNTPGAGDSGVVVRNIPSGTQPVSGTVTANAGTGTFAVSGTVTANAGTNLNTSALALDATLTGGTQRTKITDGTNNAAVKAASTAAAATDPAVVVAVSPNNTVGVTGTFWQATQPVSGTVTANAGTGTFAVNQTQVNGVAVSTQQGVADTGTQRVTMAQEATYAAATAAKTATAAGTASFFEICGSASKTVRVQRISVSGTVATTAVYGDVQIRKNSSALTGGTATTLTKGPYDSTSAAATATVKYFTVLPTGGGALVNNIFAQTLFFPVTGTPATFQPQLVYFWRDQDAEAPTLRGTAECLAVGFGTTTTNAPTLSVSVAWTEK